MGARGWRFTEPWGGHGPAAAAGIRAGPRRPAARLTVCQLVTDSPVLTRKAGFGTQRAGPAALASRSPLSQRSLARRGAQRLSATAAVQPFDNHLRSFRFTAAEQTLALSHAVA